MKKKGTNEVTEYLPKIASHPRSGKAEESGRNLHCIDKPWDLCLAKGPERVNIIQHAGSFAGVVHSQCLIRYFPKPSEQEEGY